MLALMDSPQHDAYWRKLALIVTHAHLRYAHIYRSYRQAPTRRLVLNAARTVTISVIYGQRLDIVIYWRSQHPTQLRTLAFTAKECALVYLISSEQTSYNVTGLERVQGNARVRVCNMTPLARLALVHE